jgi:hypothetical protein
MHNKQAKRNDGSIFLQLISNNKPLRRRGQTAKALAKAAWKSRIFEDASYLSVER